MNDKEKHWEESQDDDEYEKVCYVCRRPESKAGKMISMPPGIDICFDCMQNAFNTIQNTGLDMGMMSGVTPDMLWNMGMPAGMWVMAQNQKKQKYDAKIEKPDAEKPAASEKSESTDTETIEEEDLDRYIL